LLWIFCLLLGEAEEFHHLLIVTEANDEHGIVLISIDLVSHTDSAGTEECDGMIDVVAPDNRVVGEVEGLLATHERERVVGLASLGVVLDRDPNLVQRIETDVEGVLHGVVLVLGCVLCVLS
jgi:hypothetical protein